MDARTLRVLEYDAVRKLLRGHGASSLGKELAERLRKKTMHRGRTLHYR